MLPQARADQGQRIAERGLAFGVPSACAYRDTVVSLKPMGDEDHEGESPMSTGVVRAMAWSDHCRWVSTPRWARTSSKVTFTGQRGANQVKIALGSAFQFVHKNACGSNLPWGSRTSTQRIGTGGLPLWYHTAVPLAISTVRSP